MSYLILIRHGQSRWNSENKFTGWVDVPLSEKGVKEAISASKKLQGLTIDVAFTSRLVRAQETLLLILAKQNYTGIFLHGGKQTNKWSLHPGRLSKCEIPIYSSTALNERYYGDLQGRDKAKTRKKYGAKKVHLWRRSYSTRPPGGESLKDTYNRAVPYFKKEILPELKKGKNVLVSAHGNSLRSIIKYLDNISIDDIPNLEIPTGKAIVYQYSRGKLIRKDHIHSFKRKIHWKKPNKKN